MEHVFLEYKTCPRRALSAVAARSARCTKYRDIKLNVFLNESQLEIDRVMQTMPLFSRYSARSQEHLNVYNTDLHAWFQD